MNYYSLQGQEQDSRKFPQVEPSASYWSHCAVLETVRAGAVRAKVPPHGYESNSEAELDFLRELSKNSTDPAYFASNANASVFLTDAAYFKELPPGAVVTRNAIDSGITTGIELATLFEAETPGLWHMHVLHNFFDPRKKIFGENNASPADLSPPAQALVWAALETAISSALMAAWHYKWFESLDKPPVGYRPRPSEFPTASGIFTPLYDKKVDFDAERRYFTTRSAIKTFPQAPNDNPGTPRHPSYPSGHSTYAMAASTVLGTLFPAYVTEFNKLANNIGMARLWGGVHWLSDHTFGQEIGKAVGDLVMAQLDDTGISGARELQDIKVPMHDEIVRMHDRFKTDCGQTSSNFRRDGIWRSFTPGTPTSIQQNVV